MSVSFNKLYELLKNATTHELPDEVVEVCRLTPEAYRAIYLALPAAEQDKLRNHYAMAERNITLLNHVVDTGEVKVRIDIAIGNLLDIRDYQNANRLIDGLEPSVDRDFLQMTYYGIEKGQRRYIVNTVLSVSNELPHASHREAAIVLLASMTDQENRLRLLPGIVQMANLCRNTNDVICLRKLCKVVYIELGVYFGALNMVLRQISPENWERVYLAIKGDSSNIIFQFSIFLTNIKNITAEESFDLLDVISTYIGEPRNLHDSLPLIALCEEGSHVAQIVKSVAQMEDMQRKEVVDQVAASFVSTTDSSIVYETLVRVRDIVAEDMFVNILVRRIQRMHVRASFTIDRRELDTHCFRQLHNFIRTIRKWDLSPESIAFHDSEGRGPGIAKECLSQLVSSVCKKLGFAILDDGRMRLTKQQPTEEEIEVYQNLGQLFMYCMHKELVIGMQLDPGLFYALTHLNESYTALEISEDTIDQFFPLYAAMMNHYEDDRSAINLIRASLHEDETVEVLVESMSKILTPCIAIWQGTGGIPENMSAEELERRIQGTVTAEGVIKQVEFHPEVALEIRERLIEWIGNLEANPKKLMRFLTVVTGAPGLGPKPILIEISGISIQAHTCAQLLSLPSDITIDEMLKELDVAMQRENYFSDK